MSKAIAECAVDAWREHLPFEQVPSASNEIDKTKKSIEGKASTEVLGRLVSACSLCAWQHEGHCCNRFL